MKNLVIVGFFFILFVPPLLADTYITFATRRYYSPSRKCFLEITTSKEARLFIPKLSKRPIWTKPVKEFPGKVFLQDDGKRVILFERYYGNNHQVDIEALIFLNEKGEVMKSYRINSLHDLKNVAATTSSSYWYEEAYLSDSGRYFVVQTSKLKYDQATCWKETPPDKRGNCLQSIPFEQIHFDLNTGDLLRRYRLIPEEK